VKLAAAVLVVAACGKSAPRPPPDAGAATWSVKLASADAVLPDGLVVEIDGAVVEPEENVEGKYWYRQIEQPAGEPPPGARATYPGPCGITELPLTWDDHQLAKHKRTARFTRPPGARVAVHVDNRDAPATAIAIGETRLPVEAGAVTTLFVDVPAGCAPEVRVGDEVVGGLAGAQPIVVDPSGKHCYEHRTAHYSTIAGGVVTDRAVAPARFHALAEPIDHFLSDPPQQLRVEIGDRTHRKILAAVTCGARGARPGATGRRGR
jgi:hypothetical protein